MDTGTHCNSCGARQEEIEGAYTLTDPMLQLYKKCSCNKKNRQECSIVLKATVEGQDKELTLAEVLNHLLQQVNLIKQLEKRIKQLENQSTVY